MDPSFEVCWNCGTSADGVEDPTFAIADSLSVHESPLDLDMPEGDAPIPQTLNPAAGELVEAYLAADLMQAKFVADRLTEQGIPAVSDLHDMHEALGSMNSGPRRSGFGRATSTVRCVVGNLRPPVPIRTRPAGLMPVLGVSRSTCRPNF